MCAPTVIGKVNQEITRRRVLGLLAAPALAGAVAPPAEARQSQSGVMLAGGFTEIHDLTHVLSPATPVYPILPLFRIEETFSLSDGFFANELTFNEHCGTHLDAPNHFSEGGASTDQMDARQFFAPLAVIDISDRATGDADTAVTVADIQTWERSHGPLPDGAFIAMRSGWGERIGSSERYLNADAQGAMHFPGFGADSARLLTEERDIVGVGVDTLSLDVGTSADFASHLTFLPAGKYGIELMANLGSVPPAGATIIVGAPKHEGGSGGPARVFAVS